MVDVNPEGLDDQAYVVPATVAAPNTFELPMQILLLVPALAAGNGLTVTTREFVLEQLVAVIVSVKEYVVVTVGETDGFDNVEVKPDGDDVQLYVLPATEAAPIVTDAPLQIEELAPVVAAGKGLTVTIAVFVALQVVAVIVSTKV